MDTIEKRKMAVLAHEGYKYHFSRMVFFHPTKKKMFSREFIDDRTLSDIKKRIDAPKTKDWQFYFNKPLSDAAKREILSEFGK